MSESINGWKSVFFVYNNIEFENWISLYVNFQPFYTPFMMSNMFENKELTEYQTVSKYLTVEVFSFFLFFFSLMERKVHSLQSIFKKTSKLGFHIHLIFLSDSAGWWRYVAEVELHRGVQYVQRHLNLEEKKNNNNT